MDFSLLVRDPDKKARSLVRKITHSGDTELDPGFLKELKAICKASKDEITKAVYKECLKSLSKEHSQVRVATVRLLDYLFQKSHIIRANLLDEFDIFLERTLAISKRPKIKIKLPPPKKYAALLQEITIKCIHRWHSDYGPGYERIRYIYKYLREHQLVDFSQLQVRTREDQIKQQKLAEQQEKILTRSIENKLKEYRDIKPEVERLIAQIESLLDLLISSIVPLLDDDDLKPDNRDSDDGLTTQRQHGIANLSQSVEIEFSPYVEVEKCADNKEALLNLKELKKELVEGKLTRLAAIERTICKRSDKFVGTIKDLIDLKSKTMNLVLKLNELKIITDPEGGTSSGKVMDGADSDSDDSDDFEEVAPKEDLESYIPKSMRREYGLEAINPHELASSSKSHQLVDESFDSTSGASCSMDNTTETVIPLTCNVLLESGKLCPRRDKIKCPFHGKIIPRDLEGVPLNEADRLEEERKRNKKPTVPDWQDPELLRDIKAATGVDLTMPAKGRSLKKDDKKKLVNAKTCDITPKQRLQKRLKLLSK